MNNWTDIKRDDVEFHKTFQLTDLYIVKIMELAAVKYTGTKEEISNITGIPTGKTSGKVIPHIRYSAFMGLIDYEKEGSVYRLSLTQLGKIVLKEDKYLFESVTKWLCHYFISDVNYGAYLFSFLYKYLPFQLDSSISKELIERRVREIFQHDYDMGIVRRTYTEGFFEALGVFDWDDSLIINSLYYKNELKYVYAYTLLDSWERNFPDERELTVDCISDELYWSRRFGFDKTEMLSVFDELEILGAIKLNKQLHPCTVIKFAKSEDYISKLYSELA